MSVSITINGAQANQPVSDLLTINPFSGVTISDDSGETEMVTVTPSSTVSGTLSPLLGGSVDPTSGVFTDTGLPDDVTADLKALIFTPTPGTPGQGVTTGFTITDTNTASLSADPDTTTSVIAVGGPLIIGTGLTTTINQTSVHPFSDIAISDDDSQTETVTVTFDSTKGTLGAVGSGIDDGAGTYTVSGSASDVTSALSALVFTPTQGAAGDPAVTTDFTINVIDSVALFQTDTQSSVETTAGPVISGAVPGWLITDLTTVMPFTGVSITDDPNQTVETLTVTLSDAASGSLSSVTSAGSYDAGSGVYTASGTAADVTGDLQGLVFTPALGFPGQSITTTFTINDTDGASVSATDTTTSIVASAGPVITVTSPTVAATGLTAISLFDNVTITDNPDQIETVSMTVVDAANGSLTGLLGASSYIGGVYTDTGFATDVTTDLQALMFTPASVIPGQPVTTTFTISDRDSAAVIANAGTVLVVASFSSSAPTLIGTPINVTVTNQATVMPFSNLAIGDNANETESLTVALSDPANGSLNDFRHRSLRLQYRYLYCDRGSRYSQYRPCGSGIHARGGYAEPTGHHHHLYHHRHQFLNLVGYRRYDVSCRCRPANDQRVPEHPGGCQPDANQSVRHGYDCRRSWSDRDRDGDNGGYGERHFEQLGNGHLR